MSIIVEGWQAGNSKGESEPMSKKNHHIVFEAGVEGRINYLPGTKIIVLCNKDSTEGRIEIFGNQPVEVVVRNFGRDGMLAQTVLVERNRVKGLMTTIVKYQELSVNLKGDPDEDVRIFLPGE